MKSSICSFLIYWFIHLHISRLRLAAHYQLWLNPFLPPNLYMSGSLPHSTTVWAWLKTVVICKQPGHLGLSSPQLAAEDKPTTLRALLNAKDISIISHTVQFQSFQGRKGSLSPPWSDKSRKKLRGDHAKSQQNLMAWHLGHNDRSMSLMSLGQKKTKTTKVERSPSCFTSMKKPHWGGNAMCFAGVGQPLCYCLQRSWH